MQNLEISGKTVEEAIQRALKQLGVTREQVEVVVLKEGRTGILGIGAEEARIGVRLLEPSPGESPIVDLARDVVNRLLTAMDIAATVVVTGVPLPDAEEGASMPVTIDIKGEDLGILIGRRGQTLAALQYIVRLIVAQQSKSTVPVIIDIEGYKQRYYEAVRVMARGMAEQVVVRKTPMALRPMSPYERRVVHLALADHPGVTTESTGTGIERKVVILPKGR